MAVTRRFFLQLSGLLTGGLLASPTKMAVATINIVATTPLLANCLRECLRWLIQQSEEGQVLLQKKFPQVFAAHIDILTPGDHTAIQLSNELMKDYKGSANVERLLNEASQTGEASPQLRKLIRDELKILFKKAGLKTMPPDEKFDLHIDANVEMNYKFGGSYVPDLFEEEREIREMEKDARKRYKLQKAQNIIGLASGAARIVEDTVSKTSTTRRIKITIAGSRYSLDERRRELSSWRERFEEFGRSEMSGNYTRIIIRDPAPELLSVIRSRKDIER